MKLEEIVALSVKHNVSDLHLCNSAAPRWRRQGRLQPAPFPAPDIANLLNDWLDAAQLLHWQEHGQIDFALNLACGARLRASAFAHTRGISLVLRLLPEQCPRLDMLGAPPALSELLAEESGLLLVTGATGSGKSTTLAAMVGHLNQHLDGHILTL
ncbi:twitching motility protein PilT, partial [Klebsiella pneumoniae]